MSPLSRRLILTSAALLLAFFAVGCTTPKNSQGSSGASGAGASSEPPPTVQLVPWLPAGSRIVMLPIYTKETVGAALRDMDAIFRAEFMEAMPFEIVPVSRAELMALTHREQISSTEALPPDLLRALREKYAASAVMFTDITFYRPYRPISFGVRAKLVSMDTLQVLWAADRVVDSADHATADAAVHFADPTTKVGSERANQVILQSPRRFADFVAHEIYSTLPPQ